MTQRVGQLASISLDCPDPDQLAAFYSRLLGLEEAFATPDRGVIALAGAGPMLTLMRAANYVKPSWPEGSQHQQMHLDVAVEGASRRHCRSSRRPGRSATARPYAMAGAS